MPLVNMTDSKNARPNFRRSHSWRDNIFSHVHPAISPNTFENQIQIGRLSNIYFLSYYSNLLANF